MKPNIRKKACTASVAHALMAFAGSAWADTHTDTLTGNDTSDSVAVGFTYTNGSRQETSKSVIDPAGTTPIQVGSGNDNSEVVVNISSSSATATVYGTYADEGEPLTVNADKVDIDESAAYRAFAICRYGSSTFNVGTMTVDASASYIQSGAIWTVSGGSLDLSTSGEVKITSKSGGSHITYGINNEGGTSDISAGSLTIIATGSAAEGIENSGDISLASSGDILICSKSTNYYVWGIYNNGKMDISGGGIVCVEAVSSAKGFDAYEAYGILNVGNAEAVINADTVEVTAADAQGISYAVINGYGGTLEVYADTINIGAAAGENAYAVYTYVVTSTVLGKEGSDSVIKITASSTSDSASHVAAGIAAFDYSSITVYGESLEVTASAENGADAYGIGAGYNAAVSINSGATKVKSDNVGLYAYSYGEIEVNGSLSVEARTAIEIGGSSTITINKSGTGTVKLDGDIVFAAYSSEDTADSSLNLSLTTSDSYWTGNSYLSNPEGSASTEVTGFQLTLSSGATCNVTKVDENDSQPAVNDLTSDGGVISLTVNVSGGGGTLEYGTMKGDGGLTKTGSGTLTLTDATEYTGATTVEGGTLRLEDPDTTAKTSERRDRGKRRDA